MSWVAKIGEILCGHFFSNASSVSLYTHTNAAAAATTMATNHTNTYKKCRRRRMVVHTPVVHTNTIKYTWFRLRTCNGGPDYFFSFFRCCCGCFYFLFWWFFLASRSFRTRLDCHGTFKKQQTFLFRLFFFFVFVFELFFYSSILLLYYYYDLFVSNFTSRSKRYLYFFCGFLIPFFSPSLIITRDEPQSKFKKHEKKVRYSCTIRKIWRNA